MRVYLIGIKHIFDYWLTPSFKINFVASVLEDYNLLIGWEKHNIYPITSNLQISEPMLSLLA